MATSDQADLLTGMSALLNSEKSSDLTLSCQGRLFHVHKAFMCSASPVIARACDIKMKDGISDVMKHKEFDADTVERIISYIYTHNYQVVPKKSSKDNDDEQSTHNSESGNETDHMFQAEINEVLHAHVEVYGIADYCEIHDLKHIAATRFQITASCADSDISKGLIDLIKAVNRRVMPNDVLLKSALREYVTEHCEAICGNTVLMSQLAETEGTQMFAADILSHLVARNTDQEKINAILAARVKELETAADKAGQDLEARLKRQHERDRAELSRETQKSEHTEEVTSNLVRSIESLPSACPNSSCKRKLGEFQLERKGSARYGAGKGDWVVRCACRSRL